MPFTDDQWSFPKLNVPYREAWPVDLRTPRDMLETMHGMYCVREATIALIAAIGDYPTLAIWVATNTQRGSTVLDLDEPLTGRRAVLVFATPRPACNRYMIMVGESYPPTLASIDGIFAGDDASVRAIMALDEQEPTHTTAAVKASDLRQLEVEAARLVAQQWPAILALAQALADARGHLQGPKLQDAITAALQTTTGQPE